MLKHLPKIVLSVAALFGMWNSFVYIDRLSDTSAASGVEEVLPLRLFDWSQGVELNANFGSFLTFALIGGVCASFIARRKDLSTTVTLVLIIVSGLLCGSILGGIQNRIVANIGHSIVAKHPDLAEKAITTYYVQRITSLGNNYKNALVPSYAGDNARSVESELFIVNMFYLVDDPVLVIGNQVRGQDLMKVYFADAVDRQARNEPWVASKYQWKFSEFFKEYQTPHYDLRRISNAVVQPIVLAITMLGLLLSAMIFVSQLLGLGGGHFLKVRTYALAGLAIVVLTVPLLTDSKFHGSPAVAGIQCHTPYCGISRSAMDWFFRFELGVLNLMSLVD